LRVLQEGEVEPLGGAKPVKIDVRVVAATHRDLKQRVADGAFREDLFFRLNVVDIPVSPLRERAGDVGVLAQHFLSSFGNGKLELAAEATTALEAHRWPGNVRELRNAIERASIFCRDGVVRPEDLPRELTAADPSGPTGPPGRPGVSTPQWDPNDDFQTAKQKIVERFERDILTAALDKHSGNISQAARELGLHRQNLQQKLRQLEISAESFRS
jgi:two-component system NtrC family response regulator